MSQAADDSFELYDLRVEAVIPEGARVYCGAKPGDYFELRGEMLSLPLGQGFSIYSLAAVLPALSGVELGTRIRARIPAEAFRRIVLGVLLIMGLAMIGR